MLRGHIYLSTTAQPFSEQELEELEEFAAEKNRAHGITGYLAYDHGRFVQYFEGEAEIALRLLKNIEGDPRHQIDTLFHDESLAERRFPTWQMRRLTSRSMIQLEHLLQQHLELIDSLPGQVRDEASIWRMVDRLSKARNQLQLER